MPEALQGEVEPARSTSRQGGRRETKRLGRKHAFQSGGMGLIAHRTSRQFPLASRATCPATTGSTVPSNPYNTARFSSGTTGSAGEASVRDMALS